MTTGLIFDIRRFSIHDGPGIRTTVFFKGCPLGCWWCHNPEGIGPEPEVLFRPERCIRCGACQESCPHSAIELGENGPRNNPDRCLLCGECIGSCCAEARQWTARRVTVEETMAEILRDRPFFDESRGGVTFSGGEPLLQPAFLRELLAACKQEGIHTALDTAGFAPREVVLSLLETVDLFLFDFKLADPEKHWYYTGVSNAPILENLSLIDQAGGKIILRFPVIPGLNDGWENVRELGELATSLKSLEKISLLPYHQMGEEKYLKFGHPYRLAGCNSPSPEEMKKIQSFLEGLGVVVTIGG